MLHFPNEILGIVNANATYENLIKNNIFHTLNNYHDIYIILSTLRIIPIMN
jgi:hypothetical protein